ncbi:hypothetical protein T229_07205 [Tannerella sp. oral taxon BU063 isolate Cell 5]|uniref:Methyltransferase small domain-containing protein n=1 Tax=Tannerella sp. oral taxon BU063 isolate Cell 5 TaxID=1410950 RepID=W2CE39_9BACT|nr:hypothetical protein T229_07205 [Tannerella sp. oral taxon BU063 isolate Cell 5]
MAYRSAPLYEDVIWRTHLQPQDPTLAQAVRATIAKHREHLLEFIRLDEPAPLNAMTLAQWSSPNVLSSLLAVYSDHIYHLNSGGELRIVANAFLPYPDVLDETFGFHEVIAQTGRFKVYRAIMTRQAKKG